MPARDDLGGIVHSYQKYDPARIPPPRPPETDLVSPAMEHLLEFGDIDELTPEQLAEAVTLDPEQIRGLGPSLASLRRILEERKRRLLERYDAAAARKRARQGFRDAAARVRPPAEHRDAFSRAVREEQLRLLERLWYRQDDDQSRFAAELVGLVDRLGGVYEIDEMAARWNFTGREVPDVARALEVKAELEEIDRLLAQLEEAQKNGRVAIIDMEALARYAESGELDELARLRAQVEDLVERMAAEQGLERGKKGFELTPKALRLFQGKLLERIFADLAPSRSGRHAADVAGEGAVECVPTRAWEFGDSVAHLDVPGSIVNALVRQGGERPLRLRPADLEIHATRNSPKCATSVILDMSGSMRHGRLHVAVKKMALALQGIVQREFPGDRLDFLEMASFATPVAPGDLVRLMPKPVTIFDPVVHLRADMSNPDITPADIPPHFTNIQHALCLARRRLARADTPNRQAIVITDGLPTAHFEGSHLHLRYPPHRSTEQATLREVEACRRDGIVVNVFLLSGWSQSSEDIQFAYRLARAARGRVFFTSGRDLDRFVVWDYLARRRSIIG
ncbi:MAG: hypothetical protein ACKO5R_03445 [Planctomycetaceae bacterium]